MGKLGTDDFSGCMMRTLNSILIGTVIVAWMAFLSWPVTVEPPAPREKSVESKFTPKYGLELPSAEAYEMVEPKATQPSV
jgi:hypothetical protein